MTQLPATTDSSQRSHGRGGAGNINAKPGAQVDASALQTPTIKQPTYTTGRGGSGNMANNDLTDPLAARLAQDVEAPKAHDREIKGTYHWGRGGEGNMMTVGSGSNNNNNSNDNNINNSKPTNVTSGHTKSESRPSNALRSISRSGTPDTTRRGSFREAVDKGKELLGLSAAKKDAAANAAKNESAIE